MPSAGALTTWPSDGLAAGAWGAGGGGPVNPQNLNRYSYAANNPTTFNDPSGHIVPLLAVGGAIGLKKLIAVVGGGAAVGAGVFGAGYAFATPLSEQSVGGWAQSLTSGAVTGALTVMGGPITGLAARFVAPQAAPWVAAVAGSFAAELSGVGAKTVGDVLAPPPPSSTSDPAPWWTLGTLLADGSLGLVLPAFDTDAVPNDSWWRRVTGAQRGVALWALGPDDHNALRLNPGLNRGALVRNAFLAALVSVGVGQGSRQVWEYTRGGAAPPSQRRGGGGGGGAPRH